MITQDELGTCTHFCLTRSDHKLLNFVILKVDHFKQQIKNTTNSDINRVFRQEQSHEHHKDATKIKFDKNDTNSAYSCPMLTALPNNKSGPDPPLYTVKYLCWTHHAAPCELTTKHSGNGASHCDPIFCCSFTKIIYNDWLQTRITRTPKNVETKLHENVTCSSRVTLRDISNNIISAASALYTDDRETSLRWRDHLFSLSSYKNTSTPLFSPCHPRTWSCSQSSQTFLHQCSSTKFRPCEL